MTIATEIRQRFLSTNALRERMDRLARSLSLSPVPWAVGTRELAVLGHVAARAYTHRDEPSALLRALVDLAFIEGSLLAFGRGGMLADGGAFHPLGFLPNYHGPHFHRALRRLFVPGLGPFVLHLSITGACPWLCRYCFASAGGPDAPDVGEPALLRVADAIARERVPIVILGGGEPLSRFDRVLRVIEALSGASEVRLATSGTGLTPQRARALRAAGLGVLAISLDSHERARVDASRGDGAFDAATRALTVAAGASLETLVTCVVGPRTDASQLDGLLTLVRSLHPRAIVNFLPEFATGRGGADGFRTPAEYAPFGAELARVIRRENYRAAAFYAPPMDKLVGCVGAAQRQVVVDTRANLNACVSGASFGNLLEEPFDLVWARMRSAPARLKQGYFCSHVNEGTAELPRDERAMLGALEAFFQSAPDATLQRVIDALGPWIERLVPEDAELTSAR